ncbi:hypothetical protein QTP86_014890 [Hemibagrus guttatus]|nr:hypothetical protein QTP86_014890 [Hemibagrus guttatus]
MPPLRRNGPGDPGSRRSQPAWHISNLEVAHEAWEGQHSPFCSIIVYVQDIQVKIDWVGPIVREHMEGAQRDQQRAYNWPVQSQEFQTGDQVMLLAPNTTCKFLAKWQGPYTVLEQMGPVNYHLQQPDPQEHALVRRGEELSPASSKPPSPPLGAIGSIGSCPLATFQCLKGIVKPSLPPTLDDELIHSATWADHLFHLMEEKKVEAIRDYPQPTTKKQTSQERANGTGCSERNKTKQAFQQLKTALTSHPLLQNPDFSLSFTLHTELSCCRNLKEESTQLCLGKGYNTGTDKLLTIFS